MKIVIALDSFKGSCSAQAACAAVAEDCAGLTRRWSWSKCPCPTAERDCCRHWRIVRCLRGGVATAALYLALWPLPAGGFPDPARRAGHYRDGAKLWARTHAASAADVRQASSYGLGEQVKAALDAGCRHLIIGTGGSATNDGGIGFARALGARFWRKDGTLLPAPAAGQDRRIFSASI